jgi:hypothetical protein
MPQQLQLMVLHQLPVVLSVLQMVQLLMLLMAYQQS